ncbi:MFS transporter [Pendulispora brunnea]|uniref:MFS transporter n=1 Tax=Pendulispora brunnea TaxID=2905690 RepID=A0ABZ2KBF4_9BACT
MSRADSSRPVLLAATSISYILVILDSSIVNVALPSIGASIGVSITGLQWIVNAYLVIFASFLLSGGSFCDRFGARRIYMLGLSLFVGASLVCGVATSIYMLLLGRVLQGYGAALLVPSSLALIIHAYEDATERSRAIATWASWGGLAMVLGPLTGGLFIKLFGWRSIFLVNVPIGLAGIGLTLRLAQADVRNRERRIDFIGQITANVAAVSLIASLIEGPVLGWTSLPILCGGAIFAVSAVTFALVETHHPQPMLPFALFRNRNFSAIAYMFFVGTLAFFGVLFVLSFYFQEVRHFSALQTGLALFPLSCCVVLGNKITARLVSRFTPRTLMLLGESLKIPRFCGLLLVRSYSDYTYLIVPLCLIGLGGGLAAPMYTSLFMSSVGQAFTGIASGVSRATGQVGSAVGVALFGALIADRLKFIDRMTMAILIVVALTASIVLTIRFIVRDVHVMAYRRAETPVPGARKWST